MGGKLLAHPPPTLFHVTHWKAGSQWVAEILKYSAPERFVGWQPDLRHVLEQPLRVGGVYATAYITARQFERIVRPRSLADLRAQPRRVARNYWNFTVRGLPVKRFVVVRDLRDTLISLYFSLKVSHVLMDEDMGRLRARLQSVDEETGLVEMMGEGIKIMNLADAARIQVSWVGVPDALYLRYEDILGNEHEFFQRLIDYCEIDVSREQLRDIVHYNIFENATSRKRGEENVAAHLRKGIAGDWRNHFTPRVTEEFKRRFGQALIATGYEKDLGW